MTKHRRDADALDLLEAEDLELRRLFSLLQQRRGASVEDRADYGEIAKEIIRHVATREAALVDLLQVAESDPRLDDVASRIESEMPVRRQLIDRVEKMSRGVQGINLRVGQDFEPALEELVQIVGTEIEWELAEAIPAVKGVLKSSHQDERMQSARHLRRHAPTSLHPGGPRWRERAPVISRLITVYDHLRDFPRGPVRSR